MSLNSRGDLSWNDDFSTGWSRSNFYAISIGLFSVNRYEKYHRAARAFKALLSHHIRVLSQWTTDISQVWACYNFLSYVLDHNASKGRALVWWLFECSALLWNCLDMRLGRISSRKHMKTAIVGWVHMYKTGLITIKQLQWKYSNAPRYNIDGWRSYIMNVCRHQAIRWTMLEDLKLVFIELGKATHHLESWRQRDRSWTNLVRPRGVVYTLFHRCRNMQWLGTFEEARNSYSIIFVLRYIFFDMFTVPMWTADKQQKQKHQKNIHFYLFPKTAEK